MGNLFLIMCFALSVNSFLFDTSTSSGGPMIDNNYDYLIKLLMDERNSRIQLQQYVIKQQQDITMLTGLTRRVEKLENTTATSQNAPTNDTVTIHEMFAHLVKQFNQLQQKEGRLEQMLGSCENGTKELKEEINGLKQVSAINQLQTLSDLKTQIQDVKQNLITVIAENQARGQDLVSIYNDLGSVKQYYALFEDNTTTSITDLQKLFSQFNTTVQEITETVGFTAFGSLYGTKPSGTTLLFSDLKSSFGISNLSTFTSTGKFTCEKEGIYLVSVTVMSCSSGDSRFSIYKNNVELAPYYIGMAGSGSECNSATGTILIQLNVRDNISVKTGTSEMTVYYQWSSFTVTKLK